MPTPVVMTSTSWSPNRYDVERIPVSVTRRRRLTSGSTSNGVALTTLRQVTGITVNTVHGNERTIAAVRNRYAPDVESMEGAAFMYASLIAGVPFVQVRAVSNAVTRRNRGAWRVDEAIRALGEASVRLLESISSDPPPG